ncbi:Hypp272 [Branchiostoma lanceolatum]|uniref:Hypp272 protein n=1 Tax=Branchiostoma lanceolatum TaxID=7740 RepID=A0A8J9VZ06_BRALA|nr:Hypp272 [Branchiostoma lanceolatum]
MKVVFLSAVVVASLVLMCSHQVVGGNVWDLLDQVNKRSCQGKITQGQFCKPHDQKDVCCGYMGCYNVRGHDCDPQKEVCICRPKNRYPF